jgi:O-antigen/teichoic acid export membrane protein
VSADAGRSSYGAGARILSIGIATTGLVTFAYFAIAANVLDKAEYSGVSLLWSILFIVTSVIYRPIEQLLSRSISEARALGHAEHALRTPMLLQAAFAAAFVVVALALRPWLVDDVFNGAETLYWVLVGGTVAYAASYFARGWLAGNGRFGLYGGLVLFESLSRVLFPLGVALGIASGQSAVALGILAAPLVSLVVVPAALRRHNASRAADAAPPPAGPSLRAGGGFAVAVFAVVLAEQALLNVPVLFADATSDDPRTAGIVFNALLIARAPLQLFQAIQTSLLPHLTAAEVTADRTAFARAIRTTLLAIAGFAAAVTLGLLVVGPFAMELLFDHEYGRWGLAAVGLGMGFHLAAGTLNQAALARGRQRAAAAAWLTAAVALGVWLVLPVVDDVLLRTQIGYAGATALLCALLAVVDRRALRPAGGAG